MFFFLTLYMQNVLGYSPIQTGLAYLPLTFGVGIAAGIASQLLSRIGTRPVIVAGALIAAGGVYWLSRIPVDGSYVTDLLPGLMVMSLGLGAVFVAVTTAANAGVPADKAGLAAALLNASQQVGGALGLAIFSAIATCRTNDLLAAHAPPGGAHRRLPAGAARLRHLPRRRGARRPAHHEHARRGRARRRRAGRRRAGRRRAGATAGRARRRLTRRSTPARPPARPADGSGSARGRDREELPLAVDALELVDAPWRRSRPRTRRRGRGRSRLTSVSPRPARAPTRAARRRRSRGGRRRDVDLADVQADAQLEARAPRRLVRAAAQRRADGARRRPRARRPRAS